MEEGKTFTPGSPEWERKARLLAEERSKPQGLWWLSFCDVDKPAGEQFLGVAIVRAGGPVSAMQRAWDLGINPGGEVMNYQLPDDAAARVRPYMDRLLSREEITKGGFDD